MSRNPHPWGEGKMHMQHSLLKLEMVRRGGALAGFEPTAVAHARRHTRHHSACLNLLKRCLEADPSKRPSAEDVEAQLNGALQNLAMDMGEA